MNVASIIMLTGGLIFACGIGLRFAGRGSGVAGKPDAKEETATATTDEANQETTAMVSIEEINRLVDLAVADGVVTPNEKRIIRDKCIESGIDTEKVFTEMQAKLKNTEGDAETKIRDVFKEAGDTFEGYVAKMFNQTYFKLKGWSGDKYVDGIYAENTKEPDLQFELSSYGEKFLFAVECKWRARFGKTIIIARPEQLKNYQSFQHRTGQKTFIVLGVGGTAGNPQNMYVIPVENLTETEFTVEQLKPYYQTGTGNFYYNDKKETLSILPKRNNL
ncbi:Conserved protein [uncultured Candidatus Thioglobus sp.]|nr:Conserved protein [uncultured Candidatus Thioglobus sp.]